MWKHVCEVSGALEVLNAGSGCHYGVGPGILFVQFLVVFFPLVKNIDSIKKIQKQNLGTVKRKNT